MLGLAIDTWIKWGKNVPLKERIWGNKQAVSPPSAGLFLLFCVGCHTWLTLAFEFSNHQMISDMVWITSILSTIAAWTNRLTFPPKQGIISIFGQSWWFSLQYPNQSRKSLSKLILRDRVPTGNWTQWTLNTSGSRDQCSYNLTTEAEVNRLGLHWRDKAYRIGMLDWPEITQDRAK